MRPEILFPLFAPVTSLPGIGPRLAKLVQRLAGPALVDLLWHLPVSFIDRRFQPKIDAAPENTVVTLKVTVMAHEPPPTRRLPYRVLCSDGTGDMALIFFHAKGDYLKKTLPIGAERLVSGTVERFRGQLQMTHPDLIVPLEAADSALRIEPVYRLTAGLTPRPLIRAIEAAIDRLPTLPEWIDPALLARENWQGWAEALEMAHHPEKADDLSPLSPARRRLAYDEFLANQLAIGLVRRDLRRRWGQPVSGTGERQAKIRAALPFTLTNSQETALAEIATDMASSARMLRLLQGDVGSGKTIVALLAMAIAVEAGGQAALMAPTEVLARQHHATISDLARTAGIECILVTGRERGAAREARLAALERGEAQIAVGTHAVFEKDVAFRDLRLAIIDEQHRFGVHQRLALAAKGAAVDMLVMTATPIPRTLTLTAYGDMDVSRLLEKPANRRPIDTRTVMLDRLDEVIDGLRRAVEAGSRAYWVCPLVAESESLDLAAAEDRFAQLKEIFGERVGLVHGRMKGPEKDSMMAAFAAGEIRVLVATTVIEVGVDVPEATLIVIEHAERFGLSQLHQLRGRVGRSDRPSTCLLLYHKTAGETARQRLKVIRETDDGFRIAEEDLRLRGAGEVLGTRQSGLPEFRLADLAQHDDLLQIASDDARLILEKDADLSSPRGAALRILLYLFERDSVGKYARIG